MIISSILCASTPVLSAETFRPFTFEELGQYSMVETVRLRQAKLVYVDYESLRRDFVPLRTLSDQQIDNWVLNNFAYISKAQLSLLGIRFVGRNQPHPRDGSYAPPYHFDDLVNLRDTKASARPADYGRADQMAGFTFEDNTLGLVERKGTGIPTAISEEERERYLSNPELLEKLFDKDHSDGVMTGGEAVVELVREKVLRYLFALYNALHGTTYGTVENYFTIDTGLDVLRSNRQKVPVAINGHQANIRTANFVSISSDSVYRVPGEADSYPDPSIVIDPRGHLQRTITDQLTDFGGTLVTDASMFAQLGSPFTQNGGFVDAQHKKDWAESHEKFHEFIRTGNRQVISRYIESLVEPIKKKLDQAMSNGNSNEKFRNRAKILDLRQQYSKQGVETLLDMLRTHADPEFVKLILPRLSNRVFDEIARHLDLDYILSDESLSRFPINISRPEKLRFLLNVMKYCKGPQKQRAQEKLTSELISNVVNRREYYDKNLLSQLKGFEGTFSSDFHRIMLDLKYFLKTPGSTRLTRNPIAESELKHMIDSYFTATNNLTCGGLF